VATPLNREQKLQESLGRKRGTGNCQISLQSQSISFLLVKTTTPQTLISKRWKRKGSPHSMNIRPAHLDALHVLPQLELERAFFR
jgi:hypothetical protein